MSPERLRQIAILVDSLDTVQADRLLEQLPEAVQQNVRSAVMDLPPIDEAERREIIRDFVSRKRGSQSEPQTPPATSTSEMSASAVGTYGDPRAAAAYQSSMPISPSSMSPSTTAAATSSGNAEIPEYQKYLNRRSTNDRAAQQNYASAPANPPRAAQPAQENDLIDVLSQADIETLAAVVMKETPQVLAVVLSMLPADKSTQLLELFPNAQRQDALRRLATLDDIDEQVLDHLQQQLDRIVRRRIKLKRNQRSGPQALAAILSAAHRLNANGVVNSIHQQFHGPQQTQQPNLAISRGMTAAQNAAQQPLSAQAPSFTPVPSSESNLQTQQPANANTPVQAQHSAEPVEQESTASQLLNQMANKDTASASRLDSRPEHPTAVNQPSSSRNTDFDPQASHEERLVSNEVNHVEAFSDAEIRFPFAKLTQCDRSSLEALLATAKPKLTLLALRGAPPKLLTKVLRLLPAQEAKEVEYRIQNLGATTLNDIQQAQQYLLRLASVLEDMGQFRSPRRSLLSF